MKLNTVKISLNLNKQIYSNKYNGKPVKAALQLAGSIKEWQLNQTIYIFVVRSIHSLDCAKFYFIGKKDSSFIIPFYYINIIDRKIENMQRPARKFKFADQSLAFRVRQRVWDSIVVFDKNHNHRFESQ